MVGAARKWASGTDEGYKGYISTVMMWRGMEALAMVDPLPSDVLQGAALQGNEYGWGVSSFPDALANAEAHGYACLGGQFQFRLNDGGTCEMYWLAADSKGRVEGESWGDNSRRSCSEVLMKFQRLMSVTRRPVCLFPPRGRILSN
jgi:hypothetical protein